MQSQFTSEYTVGITVVVRRRDAEDAHKLAKSAVMRMQQSCGVVHASMDRVAQQLTFEPMRDAS